MTVRFSNNPVVAMPVMFIVHVHVLMFHRLMGMFVFVPLRQVQIQAKPHQ